MASILVTGGTGTRGRPVARRLSRDGHDVRVPRRRVVWPRIPRSVARAFLDGGTQAPRNRFGTTAAADVTSDRIAGGERVGGVERFEEDGR